MKKYIPKITAGILFFFGVLTLFLSSSVIFDLFGIRAKEGNYVLFVVWANFISSIIYLFAGYGLLKTKKWTAPILFASVLILAIAFVGLLLHINSGGIYETKTIGAMVFRTLLTLVFALVAFKFISQKNNPKI
jgi:magnesium-transporting ATPase (P-type)